MFNPGGMPSSHAALVCATTFSIGMYEGFNTGTFAIAFAISSVVLYDAAGVRRQAGYHAQKINMIFDELLSGHPVSQETLKEVDWTYSPPGDCRRNNGFDSRLDNHIFLVIRIPG